MSLSKPDNEAKRLAALHRFALLDTPAERAFDDFAHLASMICEAPVAMVTFIDAERQWFKAKVGVEFRETPREQAFCAYTILGNETLIVEDARLDARFAQNPLVVADPHIRFYAGAPLIDGEGHALGSLCVIDRKPRPLSEPQRLALEALSRQVIAQMELRRTSAELAAALAEMKTLHGLLPVCMHCKQLRDDDGFWQSVDLYLQRYSEAEMSHGVCPACLEQHYPQVFARQQSREA